MIARQKFREITEALQPVLVAIAQTFRQQGDFLSGKDIVYAVPQDDFRNILKSLGVTDEDIDRALARADVTAGGLTNDWGEEFYSEIFSDERKIDQFIMKIDQKFPVLFRERYNADGHGQIWGDKSQLGVFLSSDVYES